MNADADKIVRLVQESRLFQADWYLQQYPDVALLGMSPAEHYLKYGALLERDPSEKFSTKFYLETHEEAERSGLNPLLHYIQHGRAKQLARRGKAQDRSRQAHALVDTIRTKLTSLGFTRQPLEELDRLWRTDPEPAVRAMAAWELALWHMRARTEQGYLAALNHLAFARLDAPDLEFRCKLVPPELLCHHLLAQETQGRAAYERAALVGEVTPSAMLAWINLQTTHTAKIAWLNEVLGQFSIPPVSLSGDMTSTAYDQLQAAQPLPAIVDGPKVTVLIAAYAAAATIATSLRSLQEQTWKNLEIIVIDDASPTDDTSAVVRGFAASDPRVRLIKITNNGGAYRARNCGLDHATGTYVTLHDADDWSHPSKIETQVRYLESTPNVIGCTSEQARATSDLQFTRMSGLGTLIIENVSSFLWRRTPVREVLGYWDTVRFSADSELIRRVQIAFGSSAVKRLKVGPLSFQRDSPTSIMTDDVMGMNGFYYGARKEYFDAQRHFHLSGASLKYDNNPMNRPFPAPTLMHPDRKPTSIEHHFDIVLAGDFRVLDDNLSMLIERIRRLRASAQRVGLVEVFDYHNQGANDLRSMHSALRAEVDGDAVQVLVYGDKATCDELEVTTPNCDLRDNRYTPAIVVRKRDTEFAPGQFSVDESSLPISRPGLGQ